MEGMHCGGASEDQKYVKYVRSEDVAEGQLPFLLGGGHHAGGQLRQGSAAGKDGDGDEFVGNARHAGDLSSGVDEEFSSDYQPCKSGCHECYSCGETQLLFLYFISPGSGTRLEATVNIKCEKYQEQSTFDTADAIVVSQPEKRYAHAAENEEKRNGYGHRDVSPLVLMCDGDRGDDSCKTEYEQGIEDVGADDIAG